MENKQCGKRVKESNGRIPGGELHRKKNAGVTTKLLQKKSQKKKLTGGTNDMQSRKKHGPAGPRHAQDICGVGTY